MFLIKSNGATYVFYKYMDIADIKLFWIRNKGTPLIFIGKNALKLDIIGKVGLYVVTI